MKLLTRRTMAILRIQGPLPAQLVSNLAAMTAGFITSMKAWVVVMDLVGCSELPLIVLAFSVAVIAIVPIGAICRCVFGHDLSTGVELKFVDGRERLICWTDGA